MAGPTSLSAAEIDLYSVRLCVQSGLAANGWTGTAAVPVKLASNGWPTADEITLPSIYVGFGDQEVAGIELGSHGKARDVDVYIYGKSDPQRMRLAEEVTNLFRDGQVSILDFSNLDNPSPASVDRYTIDEVGWRPVPMPSSAVDVDKWRAIVEVRLRRSDA